MCGRFTFSSPISAYEQRFRVVFGDLILPKNFNVAPTQNVLAIKGSTSGRQAAIFRWGLIPSWAKDKAIGAKMINARAETLAEKPSFREAFIRRRCLVLADAFCEWKATPKGKIPHIIRLKSQQPFAFAGLWEQWKDHEGKGTLDSCTIITTTPNTLMEPIHNRMPVITSPDWEEAWLDPQNHDTDALQGFLKPYSVSEMEAYPVSNLINSPRNNGPECVEPIIDGIPTTSH